MKKYKFIALSAIIALSTQQLYAKDSCSSESGNYITNSRDVFGELLIYNVPNSFSPLPGDVYEDRTWYRSVKYGNEGEQKEVLSITAYRNKMLPDNTNNYLSERVKQVASTCSTGFSTFNLPDTQVLGVDAKSAVWKCGESGGWRRKVKSVIMASRTFEKDGVFYELSWTKYEKPSKEPLSESDRTEAINMLNMITPYVACKNNPEDKDYYKQCIAHIKK